MSDLSFSDRQNLVATAAGIESYCIRDMFDDKFIYREDRPTGKSKLYSRSYAIADGKVTLGDKVEVMQKTEYEAVSTAAFSMTDAEATFSGDEVIVTGKMFEAGDYPDRGINISEEDLNNAASVFSAVKNNIEHVKTILNGKVGELRSVVAKGKELFGTVAVPRWLYDANGSEPLKPSLEWDRATKQIVGNALVINPRISDAQLVAAFSAAKETTLGGVKVPIAEKKEPSWFEKLKALFSADEAPDEIKASFSEGAPAPPANPIVEPAKSEPAANFNTGIQARLLTADAEKFVDDAIKAGKAFPAQRDSLIAQFKQAVEDDNTCVACFSDEGALKEGKRVKMLRDSVEAVTPHVLFSEKIPGSDDVNHIAMFAAGSAGKPSTDEMAAVTPLGAKAVELKKKKGGQVIA